MKTLSLDLRDRIVAAYDIGDATREQIAGRFMVSLGMVKKLLAQRKATGDIGPRHQYSGRKPKITDAHRQRLRELVDQRPDSTLEQLRAALDVECSLAAIHYTLVDMGLTYKKRVLRRPSKTGPT